MKFWNFKETDGEDVELRIDGDIIDDDQSWIYEWLGMPATHPNAFREELAAYAGRRVVVWIDSYGGSVYAGTGIYNALKEHCRKGGHVTTIGDAKVMSAATVIFMAGEERKLAPGCVFMIHNPLLGISGYADDLRKAADVLDTIKDTILNAYELETGMPRDELSRLMDEETYMSPQTAIKQGFATAMLYSGTGDPVNAGPKVDFNRQRLVNFASKDKNELAQVLRHTLQMGADTIRGGVQMDHITNTAELEQQYGELVAQVRNEAVTAERTRMAALDALDDGSAQVHAIILHAKENGQTAEEVQFFVDTAKQAAGQQPKHQDKSPGEQFMEKLIADNKQSGVDDVKGYGSGGQEPKDAWQHSLTAAINKRMEGKR